MKNSPTPEFYLQDTRLWEEWTTERPKKEPIKYTKQYSLSEALSLIDGAASDEASLRIMRMKRLVSYPIPDSEKHESVINSIITIAFVHIFPKNQFDKDDTALKIAAKLQSQTAFPNVDGKGTYTAQWVEDRYRQLQASENDDYVKWCNVASDDKELSDFRTRMNLYGSRGAEWGGV